jgi:alkylated DNA repair protein alkB family protein 6
VPRLGALGAFESTLHGAPNHVLVNEYRPGEGIMMHADGDAYESVVATVSLGGSVCLRLASGSSPGREKEEGEEEGGSAGSTDAEGDADADGQGGKTWILPTRILQEPRSLLITRGVAYETLLHGIDEVEVDEGLGEETVANWGLLSDGCRERVVQAGGRCERGTRISLTYRDVKKVSKALGGVLGRR